MILSSTWVLLFTLVGIIHSYIEKKYISFIRGDVQYYLGKKLTAEKIVKLNDGSLVKVKEGQTTWGKGEELFFLIPENWEDSPGAAFKISKLIYLDYLSTVAIMLFVFDIKLKYQFSANELYDLIKQKQVQPFLESGKEPLFIGKYFNLAKYLQDGIVLDSEQDAAAREDRENKVKLFFSESGNTKDLYEWIGSTIVFKNTLSNIESIKANIEESSKNSVITMGMFMRSDVERLNELSRKIVF